MENNNEDRLARRRQQTYMTEHEMLAVISSDHFTVPMTINRTQYTLYRGRRSAIVVTLRFNVSSPQFSFDYVAAQVVAQLDLFFPDQALLSCCTAYDFVLVNNSGPERSYYIWTANSNRSGFNETEDATMSFTHTNVHRYCREAMNVDIQTLGINFHNSNCTIDRLLALTLSFIV
jgi:hypothetical protein